MGIKDLKRLFIAGTELSTKVAERTGGKVLKKQVLINLKEGNASVNNKLRKYFCPHAKEPKLEVQYDALENGSRSMNMLFRDGDKPLSHCNLGFSETGRLDYDINILSSKDGFNYFKVNGFYDEALRSDPEVKKRLTKYIKRDREHWALNLEQENSTFTAKARTTGFMANFESDTKVTDRMAKNLLNFLIDLLSPNAKRI